MKSRRQLPLSEHEVILVLAGSHRVFDNMMRVARERAEKIREQYAFDGYRYRPVYQAVDLMGLPPRTKMLVLYHDVAVYKRMLEMIQSATERGFDIYYDPCQLIPSMQDYREKDAFRTQ